MIQHPFALVFVVMALGLAATGCQQAPEGRTIAGLSGAPIVRTQDATQVAQGEQVYRQHCARCHGTRGEGHPQWRTRNANGHFPPPPLDGSGHAWHHSIPVLRQMILDGSPPGQGDMPAWRGKLTDAEVEAVIAWFQSLWPDEVYGAWYEMQHQ